MVFEQADEVGGFQLGQGPRVGQHLEAPQEANRHVCLCKGEQTRVFLYKGGQHWCLHQGGSTAVGWGLR